MDLCFWIVFGLSGLVGIFSLIDGPLFLDRLRAFGPSWGLVGSSSDRSQIVFLKRCGALRDRFGAVPGSLWNVVGSSGQPLAL